jgi:N-acetylglutamate synthase/N-acetylornithine aminotransferase
MVTRHTTVLLIVSLATMLAAVFSDAETTEPRLRALEANVVF